MRGFDDHLDNYGNPGIDDDEPDIRLFHVLVDGIPWIDADGNDQFTKREASGLAEHLEHTGETTVEIKGS